MKTLNRNLLNLGLASVVMLTGLPKSYANGGANGGGGGTLPASPISPYQVREITIKAKKNLIPLLKGELTSFGRNTEPSALEKKVYGGKPNIYDMLISTDLDIHYDGPCKNSEGKDMDASVYNPEHPNAICLSAARVAPKLIAERAETEILALIVHELSHKLGTTEDEAVELQKDIANLLASPLGQSNALYSKDVKEAAEAVSSPMWKLALNAEKLSSEDLGKAVEEAVNADSNFFLVESKFPRSLLDDTEYAFYAVECLRLFIVDQYFLSKKDAYEKDELDKHFGSKNAMTFKEYAQANQGVITNNMRYGNEVIQRVKTDAEAIAVVKDVAYFIARVAAIPETLDFGTTPNPLPLPENKKSPFEKFVGEYAVKSYQCTDSRTDDTTKFVISKRSGDQLVEMTRYSPASTWGMNGLHNGSSNFIGGAAVTVDGGKNWASRAVEFGNRWGSEQTSDSFSQNVIKFENTPTGYVLTQSSMARHENYNNGASTFTDSTSRCTYQLEKQK